MTIKEQIMEMPLYQVLGSIVTYNHRLTGRIRKREIYHIGEKRITVLCSKKNHIDYISYNDIITFEPNKRDK